MYYTLAMCTAFALVKAGNKNKENGNDTSLAGESQLHCFADKFLITDAHSFGTDTHTKDYSQGKCRTEQCCQLKLSLNNE